MANATRPSDHFEISTHVAAAADRVWQHAVSIEGMRYELSPWLSMGVPAGVDPADLALHLTQGSVALPMVVGRSWVRLFGWLPIDWDDMTIVELEPGRRFLEHSSTLSLRVWEHERIIDPDDSGATVTDRLSWQPRRPMLGGLARRIVPALFRHRHARLSLRFE